MSDVVLRPATRADHPRIIELAIDFLGTDRNQAGQWLAEALERDTGIGLVATASSIVVGFVTGHVVLDEAEIHDLGVDTTHRRRGIGGQLITAFESTVHGHGALSCSLEVRASNTPALQLYGQHGYREVGHRAGYYPNGEDAIVLCHRWEEST